MPFNESFGCLSAYTIAANDTNAGVPDKLRLYPAGSYDYTPYVYKKIPWEDLPLYIGYPYVGRILPAIISGDLQIPQDQLDICPNIEYFLKR
ncbi:MAG: hypothetical protein GF334_05370 [Candidatus Altiarchaeales archaeon]|nr:hypothetical protein [Candidatus Altiarchaeales archaeon]